MLNSSLWRQSDSLYGAPVIASLYFILRNRPLLASIAFGIGISMKLQAIFFLPVLVGYLLRTKETRAYIVIPFLIFVITVIPVALVGGDMSYWFLVYAKESGEYPYLSVSAPSIFAFVNGLMLSSTLQNILFWCGITLAGLWAVVVTYMMAYARNYALPGNYTFGTCMRSYHSVSLTTHARAIFLSRGHHFMPVCDIQTAALVLCPHDCGRFNARVHAVPFITNCFSLGRAY